MSSEHLLSTVPPLSAPAEALLGEPPLSELKWAATRDGAFSVPPHSNLPGVCVVFFEVLVPDKVFCFVEGCPPLLKCCFILVLATGLFLLMLVLWVIID